MFGYKRYRSGAGKGYYRYSKYSRSGSRGIIRKSLRAAKATRSGTRQEDLNVQVNGQLTATLDANSYRTNVFIFTPYCGGLDTHFIEPSGQTERGAAVCDRSFRLYCAQYDEVRLNSMKIKLSPSTTGNAANSYIKLCSIVDRKTTATEESMTNTSDIPSAIEIENNPGVIITPFMPGRTSPLVRYVYASNMQERSNYMDSTIHYSTNESNPLDRMYLLNHTGSSGGFCFIPSFYCFLRTATTQESSSTISISYTVEYNFTFRNPKNSIEEFMANEAVTISSAKLRNKLISTFSQMKPLPVEEEEEETDDDVLMEKL